MISKVQVFNANWQQEYSCFGDCDATPVIAIGEGLLHIKVGTYTSGYELICEKKFDPIVTNGSALVGSESQNHFYFQVNKQQQTASLNWTTNNTFTIDKFIIERATNLFSYSTIGEVTNRFNDDGIYDFQFLDAYPEQGENHYRIKVIDREGNYHYSKIQAASFEFEEQTIQLFPNPATDYLIVHLSDWQEEKPQLSIYNQLGVLMTQQNVDFTSGFQTRIDLQDFPAGVYTLSVNGTDRRRESRLFVVTRL